MKIKNNLTFISYQNGEILHRIDLTSTKTLVGSASKCDVVIKSETISHYHCLIHIHNNQIEIVDLFSNNGIYLNGKQVERAVVQEDDRILLGDIEFLTVVTENKKTIEDRDYKKVRKINNSIISELPNNLPPKEGLKIIDDEYCDIDFNDENFCESSTLNHLYEVNIENYIDPSDDTDIDHSIDIENNDELVIEVSQFISGHMVGVQHFSQKINDIFIGPKKTHKCINSPLFSKKFQICQYDDGIGNIIVPEGFSSIGAEKVQQLGDYKLISYKTYQIMFKVVKAPPKLKKEPFWGADRNFNKQLGKVFAGLFAVYFLLNLVDIKPPKKVVKKVAVIYRKMVKAPKKSEQKNSQTPSKENKKQGVLKKDINKKPPKLAKKTPQKSVPKKKLTPKKSKPKKVAQKKVTPKKIKKYKFKLKNNFSNFLNSKVKTAKVTNNSNRSPSNTPTFKVDTNTAAKSMIGKKSKIKGLSSKTGHAKPSSGTAGLSNKLGIDSTYTSPETIVLGSMDPDLLRKILREYLPQFRHCYQQELEKTDNLKGVLDLKFRITKSGKASKIKVSAKDSRFTRPGLDCMAKVLRIIQFPSPKGGGVVDVRQPLNFYAEKSKI